jgi:hypothetical protein
MILVCTSKTGLLEVNMAFCEGEMSMMGKKPGNTEWLVGRGDTACIKGSQFFIKLAEQIISGCLFVTASATCILGFHILLCA